MLFVSQPEKTDINMSFFDSVTRIFAGMLKLPRFPVFGGPNRNILSCQNQIFVPTKGRIGSW